MVIERCEKLRIVSLRKAVPPSARSVLPSTRNRYCPGTVVLGICWYIHHIHHIHHIHDNVYTIDAIFIGYGSLWGGLCFVDLFSSLMAMVVNESFNSLLMIINQIKPIKVLLMNWISSFNLFGECWQVLGRLLRDLLKDFKRIFEGSMRDFGGIFRRILGTFSKPIFKGIFQGSFERFLTDLWRIFKGSFEGFWWHFKTNFNHSKRILKESLKDFYQDLY